MLSITETQGKILKTMNNIEKSGSSGAGITSYDIRKNSIPGRTFDINRDFLLYYQLIRKVSEEKTGKQTRTRYQVTPIGFFTILKWMRVEEIKKQITVDDLEKFIPLIASHWEDLEKLFGESLIQILKNAIDRIDIKPSELGTNQSDEPFSYIMGKALEETTELIFENKELKISLLRRYYTLSDEEKKVLGKDGFFGIRHNYDELPTDVIQRLTFVFYLELLRIHKDVLPVIKLAMDVWKIHNKTPTEVLAKEDHQARMTRMKNSADWMCIFNRKVIKASKKVIDIVRNDIELSNLLKGNLDEILPNLSNFKSVNYIREIIE